MFNIHNWYIKIYNYIYFSANIFRQERTVKSRNSITYSTIIQSPLTLTCLSEQTKTSFCREDTMRNRLYIVHFYLSPYSLFFKISFLLLCSLTFMSFARSQIGSIHLKSNSSKNWLAKGLRDGHYFLSDFIINSVSSPISTPQT